MVRENNINTFRYYGWSDCFFRKDEFIGNENVKVCKKRNIKV